MKISSRFLCVLFFSMTVLASSWLIVNRLKTAPEPTPRLAQNTSIVAPSKATPLQSSLPAVTAPVVKKDEATSLPAQAKKNAKPTAKQAAKPQSSPPTVPPAKPIISAQVAEKMNEELHEKPAYDQPREAMEYYRLKRVPEGETEIPVEKYLEAKKQMDAMPQYSSAQNRYLPSRNEMKAARTEATSEALGTWESLGPGNVGGRTRALLIHPTTPNVMYAAGVAGGVWKTTNVGARWEPLTDLMANIAVACLAFDPNNPNTIYAGTGEGFFNGNAVRGAGIFRTTDGGANWSQITATGTSDFHYVNDLVISKTNSQRIYAGTRTGIWRSLDGGGTWEKVLNYTDGCLDLVIRTDQMTDYIFAACGTFSGGEVFRNTDAGGAGVWTSVLKESGMGRTSLAIAPSNQNVVYAAAASSLSGTFRDGLHAVFRSTNSGEAGSWNAQVRNNNALKLNTMLFTNPLGAFRSECGLGANSFLNQGWYDNVIAVDPLDETKVWVGGIDLFRSDDSGVNWGLASYWWPEPSTPQYAHADHHIIAFHPQYNGSSNKQMFVGTDGGVYRTDDARALVATGVTAACNPAANGVRWTSLNNNYGVTQFYHGAVFPDGKTYFGGTQDNGTLLGTDANGANGWREIYGGDGGYVAIDPTNPNVLYASTPGGRFRRSTDGGVTFGSAILGITDARPLFIAPLAIDPSNPSQLWTGGGKVWRSANGAASWIEAGDLGQQQASSLSVSPQDSNYVLVGAASGYIYLSQTGSFGDSPYAYAPPRSGFVSGVAFDPANKEVFYAVYSTFGGSHVYRLTDLGLTRTAIDGQGTGRLPDIPVNCIAIDPRNPLHLFIGTDLGVFSSTDGGVNWAVENTGFANVTVESLVINTVNGVTSLYAFTHGRGVWRVTLGNESCTFALSSAGQYFTSDGGKGSVNVVAPANCSWQAKSNTHRATIDSGATGSGNGTVTFTVPPNLFQETFVSTLTIAGKSHTIVQGPLLDRSAPTVTIKTPLPNVPYRTAISGVTLSGSASDNSSVVAPVQITTDRGISSASTGVATFPTINWQGPIGLKLGLNNVTVTATDLNGNKGSTSLQIIYEPEYSLEIIAGQAGSGFGGDGGSAKQANISSPYGICMDKQGNLFVADTGNHRIRKINKDGIITTIAGNGTPGFSGDGGPAIQAQISSPQQITVDDGGNVYFYDSVNRRVRRVGINGMIDSVACGGLDGLGNGGLATRAGCGYVTGITVNKTGDLFIIDDNRLRKVTAATGIIDAYAGGTGYGYGGDGGPVKDALFTAIRGIAVDAQNNLYITEIARIRKVDSQGIIRTVAGNGTFTEILDNLPATATAVSPNGPITVDSLGNIYFTQGDYYLRRIDVQGKVKTIAFGAGKTDVAVDSAGNIFCLSGVITKVSPLALEKVPPQIAITSPTTNTSHTTTNDAVSLSGTASDNTKVVEIRWKNDRGGEGFILGAGGWSVNDIKLLPGPNMLTVTAWDDAGNESSARLLITYSVPDTLSFVAGTRTAGFNLESGSSISSQLYIPETVALDNVGNLYIADVGNHRVRKVTRSGQISTVAGNGQLGSSGDGGLATNASMNQPNGVAVDGAGNLYISDTLNHRIRRVTSAGIITTIAGKGLSGFSGDGGAALQAAFNTPVGVTLDGAGNLLIADAGNHRIRRLNLSTGIITTIAGNGYGSGGDGGQALQAQLNFPTSVVIDSANNLYISDTSNHLVRKVSPTGIITRFAGTGTAGFSGDGGAATAAQFGAPGGLALDAQGNLYVTDQRNNRVRKIATDGVITTVAGNGNATSQTSDEGGTALSATLNAPAGVAVDSAGNLYIADTNNHRVVVVAAYKSAATVNAASYANTQPVAAESLVSVFGANLAVRDEVVRQLPLPTELAGTSVKVRDSLGVERLAPLFFVSKLQINYQIPAGTAQGFATVTITNANGEIFTSAVNITSVTPGLFTATQNGTGAAAASVLFVRNGVFRYESNFACDVNGQNCTARQIDLNAGDEVFLELYGTGIRNNSGLTNVTVTVGGEAVPVLYANKQPDFVGLDQVNIRIPKSFAGRGEMDVVLTVDGRAANPVRINIK